MEDRIKWVRRAQMLTAVHTTLTPTTVCTWTSAPRERALQFLARATQLGVHVSCSVKILTSALKY
jgi:hypothetical protein